MNNYLQEKIKTLPKEIEAYLTSAKADRLNVLIAEKYRLTFPQVLAFADLVPQLFLKEIPATNLVEEIKHIFGFSDNIAKQMACDIAGVRLLVITDWLQTDIAGLIKSWGGNPEKYKTHVEVQQKAIVKEAKWLAEQLAEPVYNEIEEIEEAEGIDWQDREEKMKEIFGKNLVGVFNLNDDEFLGHMNDMILYLIANQREEIKDELANAMLNNTERLTQTNIVFEGKQVEPTVANWLAYFFSQKGSDMFDSLTLSDFMTNSANAKLLDAEEKRLLTNLLFTYRNLKFFPASMNSNDPKDWFIFPSGVKEKPLTNTSFEPEPQTFFAPVQSPAQTGAPINYQPPINPQAEAQIKELMAMAERYPEGSLERLAVEQEIKKLK